MREELQAEVRSYPQPQKPMKFKFTKNLEHQTDAIIGNFDRIKGVIEDVVERT